MTRYLKASLLTLLFVLLMGCSEKSSNTTKLVVENSLNVERSFETVEINLNDITQDSTAPDTSKTYAVLDAETKEELVSQVNDSDGDGKNDVLLFQPSIGANSKKAFEIVLKEKMLPVDSIPSCYSRFVPERTDDYAWENNRVAFRAFGPTAQKMVEDSVVGGTLSSGIDTWLKRVDYPIINNWYKKELETEGTYHEDTGEGLDNFHVGISRGVGGVSAKVDSSYYFSKNYTEWRTISTGPIRTSFILKYADWDANGNQISETKNISLDYGSNLSKFVIEVNGIDALSAGLTLHEKSGKISVDEAQGWVSYWEPLDDSEIGTGIVVPNEKLIGTDEYSVDRPDESNLYAHIVVDGGKVVYYAGFGWKKSGQFSSNEEWNAYLDAFAQRLKTPLSVTIDPID